MSEFITVNGKKYQTSGYLSGIFSYTPDYIGKLAREEKVLGIQIERQWFIEPTSLEVYLQKIAIEKDIQKEALRQQRKNERMAHERVSEKSPEFRSRKYHRLEVASQALVVLGCGALIGSLSFISASAQLTPALLAQGAKETVSFVGAQIKPSLSVRAHDPKDFDSENLLAGALPSQLQNGEVVGVSVYEENGVFTVLPSAFVSTETESEKNQETTTLVQTAKQIQFSDEVRVAVDAGGAYYLEPVLKQDVPSEAVMVTIDTTRSNTPAP